MGMGESHSRAGSMFRDLAEGLPVGVFLAENRNFIYVNQKFAEIHGYTVDEIVDRKVTKDLVHPEDLPHLEAHIINLLSGKPMPEPVAFRAITKSGPIVHLEVYDCHVATWGDRPVMIGTVVDVTERRRTEEELKRHRDHLKELVEERTSQLAEVNEELRQDVEERKQAEVALEIKSRNLEEVNTALRVLLKQREDDRRELEEKISSNVRELVLRYVLMLKETRLDPNQRLLLEITEKNLDDFLSPFCRRITTFDFTPKEMEVILLTKDGKTIKQMAQLFNVTIDAINRHRYHIRKKLGLNKNRRNLLSHLLSLN
jgi:PAS domain S-box-containing protein